MRSYALTYPQLMNQAAAAGWTEDDRVVLARAHALAEAMADGLYRAQGVPFLTHLVRTASIALADGHPTPVVQAALLHAAGVLHAFAGSRRRRLRGRRRRRLRAALGDEVVALLVEYAGLPWQRRADRAAHLAQLAGYGERRRQVLAIRLANELEDFLDAAMAYAGRARQAEEAAEHFRICVALAEALGLAPLARDLGEAFERHAAASVPPRLQSGRPAAYERPRRHLFEATRVERAAGRGLRALRARLTGRGAS